MDFLEDEKVCSVEKENGSGYYGLHTTWKNNGFILNVISKNGGWLGEMTENEMSDMANQLNLEKTAYLKHCREALTTHDGLQDVVYSVENGSFSWKKIVDKDLGIKLKMGSVMLQPISCLDATQNMLEAALKFNKKLLKQVNELQQVTKNDAIEKETLLIKIDKIIKAKDDLENDLYTRFLLLLNTKKKKIKELEKKNIALEKTTLIKGKDNLIDCNSYDMSTDEDSKEEWLSSQCQTQSNQTIGEFIEQNEIIKKEESPKTLIPKKKFKQVEANINITKNINSLIKESNLSNYTNEKDLSSKESAEFNCTNEDNNVLKESEGNIPSKKEDILEYFYGS